jgi:hypothetical protein
MRGRPGWAGGLDFGTLRDLERVAVQFTSDLRRVAMQSSAVGENVITDLRTILEDALERVKSEIFRPGSGSGPGSGHEEAEGKGPGTAGTAGSPADDASADASVADDTPPAGEAGNPAEKD